MIAPKLDWDPSRRRLRVFAWVIALALALSALHEAATPLAWPLRLAAAVFFATGTVWPNAGRWLYIAVLLLLWPLSRILVLLASWCLPERFAVGVAGTCGLAGPTAKRKPKEPGRLFGARPAGRAKRRLRSVS